MKLNELKPAPGARKKRKRVGRGTGSGTGGTATRGHKGHSARSGKGTARWFEGGQMPILRRLPKFGFTNLNRVEYQAVNVQDLVRFDAGTAVTPELLADAKLARRKQVPVKLLAKGTIDRALTIKVHAASAAARQKIEAAGGSVEILDAE